MRLSSVQRDTFWFLKGGGQMGERIQRHPWQETPLRAPEEWNENLKSALSLTLNSRIPTVLLWGPEHICFYNDACLPALVVGGEPPWALGKTAAEVMPEAWPQVKPLVDSVRSEGESVCHKDGFFPGDCRKLNKNKSATFCYAPVYGREGGPLGVMVTCTELAAWVKTEELHKLVGERTDELQTLNEELAATNEELAASNEELIESNRRLTRANKDLEEFAYVASHDLQEPLRKIQIFANLIDERFADQLSDVAAGYLSKVNASARRMSSLIKDLLDYSRLTFSDSLFQSVDLHGIIEAIISDFEVLIAQKKAVMKVGELPVIQAIPIQMNQLFYNLIGNAIKFSRKGVTPVVAITSRVLEDPDPNQYPGLKSGVTYYEITITDNGIGFSQEYAEQIFAIFQRLNDRTVYGGYGIGLALCRKIVENHNGFIFAVGRENEGASFTVVLPERRTHKFYQQL